MFSKALESEQWQRSKSIRDLINLFAHLWPRLKEQDAGASLQAAAIFYNDFHFIAHQCTLLTAVRRRALFGDCKSAFTLADLVPMLRKTGDAALSNKVLAEQDNVHLRPALTHDTHLLYPQYVERFNELVSIVIVAVRTLHVTSSLLTIHDLFTLHVKISQLCRISDFVSMLPKSWMCSSSGYYVRE